MDTQEKLSRVRTRFAPSPTGYLHIGGIRTALFSYLFAKHHGGEFILRVEDTDRARFVEGAIEKIIYSLNSVGIFYDEGLFMENGKLISKGQYGPYLQSERQEFYAKYALELIGKGKAYYCFCDEKRLEELHAEQVALKKPTQYDRKCRYLSAEQVEENLKNGLRHVVRQAIPEEGQTIIHDLIFKDIVYENKTLDDQVLLKSDGFPTYHLAVVVDDHLMEISHVSRGVEWIPSTPKHILLFEAFGWETPAYAHFPNIINPDGKKLSKRQGDIALDDYFSKGYLKEALINFIAFLGWNPKTDQEIFSMEQLISAFDFSKVNRASPVYDVNKLDWFNSQYIRKMEVGDLADMAMPHLVRAGLVRCEGDTVKTLYAKNGKEVKRDFIVEITRLEQERLKKLSEIGERVKYFFETPAYDPQILVWRKSNAAATRENLQVLLGFLNSLDDSVFENSAALELKVKEFITAQNLDNGPVLWPFRVALSGLEASPSPFELAAVLFKGYGKFEVLQRIEAAIKALE